MWPSTDHCNLTLRSLLTSFSCMISYHLSLFRCPPLQQLAKLQGLTSTKMRRPVGVALHDDQCTANQCLLCLLHISALSVPSAIIVFYTTLSHQLAKLQGLTSTKTRRPVGVAFRWLLPEPFGSDAARSAMNVSHLSHLQVRFLPSLPSLIVAISLPVGQAAGVDIDQNASLFAMSASC